MLLPHLDRKVEISSQKHKDRESSMGAVRVCGLKGMWNAACVPAILYHPPLIPPPLKNPLKHRVIGSL